MKLQFTSKEGKEVTLEADDSDIVVAEMQTGAQDFVMLRFKPGTLKVDVPDGAGMHMRLDGGGA